MSMSLLLVLITERRGIEMDLDHKILNILINNKRELNDFSQNVGDSVFEQQNRRFVRLLISYYKHYSSCPTLDTLVLFSGDKNKNLSEYLETMWETIDSAETDRREYSFLMEMVNQRYNAEIHKAIKTKFNETTDLTELNSFITRANSEINGMNEKKAYGESTLRSSVDDWFAAFKAKQENPETAQGIMTGFSVMDYCTNGLRGGEMVLFAADTGFGKSIFLTNFSVNCFLGKNILPGTTKEVKEISANNEWKKAYNVLFISLEMGGNEIKNRILSCMSGVNSLDLDKGVMTPESAKKISIALSYWKYGPSDIKVVDMPRGCQMSAIQNIYDDCCMDFVPDVVVIDYLGLMIDNEAQSDADWEKLKNVSEQMHEFARVNDVVVVSAVQVTDAKPGQGGVGLHRIGRSRMIAHNANLVLQIEVREDEDNRVDARIHCIKFRRGPKFIMNNLRKEFAYTRFFDLGFKPTNNNENIIAPGDNGALGEDLTSIIEEIFENKDA